MAGPWEQYAPPEPAPAAPAPWEQYAQQQPAQPQRTAAEEEGRGMGGFVQGAISALQGPAMGFLDEVAGVGGAVVGQLANLAGVGDGKTFAEDYRATRDKVRGAADKHIEDNPILGTAARVAASLPMAMVAAPAAGMQQGAGILRNMGAASKVAAGYGAVSGAGDSRAEDLGGVAQDAATGAAMSAVLGGAAVPVTRAVGAGVNNVRARFSDTEAGRQAEAKIIEALARDVRGNENIVRDPVLQAAARLGKLGDDAMVVDTGGQNTRQLLDTLATLPGKSKEAVERAIRTRQATRGERMISAADDAMGTGGARLNQTVEALQASKQAQSKPLYDRLHSLTIAPDEELTAIVDAAQKLGAGRAAQRMATAERVPYSLDPTQPQVAMRDLDLLKRGIDKLIANETDDITGRVTDVGRSYSQLKRDLTTKLDDLTKDPATGQSLYKTARDTFAGHTQLQSAATLGRKAFSQDSERLSQTMAGLSASERDAFRIGAMEGLRQQLGTQGGQTRILNAWKEPATQERLKVLFGDEGNMRRFMATTMAEGKKKGLESVGRGSQTASRMAAAEDLGMDALQDGAAAVGSAMKGNLLGAANALASIWNRAQMPEAVRDQMGKMLLKKGPEAEAQLNALRAMADQVSRERMRRAGQYGIFAGAM